VQSGDMEHNISDIPYGIKEIFEYQSACIMPESQKNTQNNKAAQVKQKSWHYLILCLNFIIYGQNRSQRKSYIYTKTIIKVKE